MQFNTRALYSALIIGNIVIAGDIIAASAATRFSINYDEHALSIVTPGQQISLDEQDQLARKQLNALNQSLFFKTEILKNKAVMQALLNRDPHHSERSVRTSDGVAITYSFFDNHKKDLVIVGPGFTNDKGKLANLKEILSTCDVAILNFRGHGTRKSLSPLYKMLGIGGEVRLGAEEEKDVIAVVNDARKDHELVIGLGICFGAFVIAKAQALAEQKGEKLFDKIIVDGMWLSLPSFAEKIIADPALIFNPQRGGASFLVKSIFKRPIVQKCLFGCIKKGTGVAIEQVDLTDLLQHITIPTLMFYGKDDLTISRAEFEKVFNLLGAHEKAAIVTSNPHVLNHIKSKELYALACQLFIEQPFDAFIDMLTNPAKKDDLEQFCKKCAQLIQVTTDGLPAPQKKSHKKLYFGAGAGLLAALLLYRNMQTYASGSI